jgi:hypothetical protein
LHAQPPSAQQLAPFSHSGSVPGSQHGGGGHTSPGSSQPRQLQSPSEQHSALTQAGSSSGLQHSPPPVVPTVSPSSLLDSVGSLLLLDSGLLLELLDSLLLDSGLPLELLSPAELSLPLSVPVGVPVSSLLLSPTVDVGAPDELSSVVSVVLAVTVVVGGSPVEPDVSPLVSVAVASPTSSAHAARAQENESAKMRQWIRCMATKLSAARGSAQTRQPG